MTASDVAAAEARATEARARLNGTVEALQSELEPQKLVQVAKNGVIDGGGRAARAGLDAARRNPAVVAGAGALLLAFFARKRIADVIAKTRNTPRSPRHHAPPRHHA